MIKITQLVSLSLSEVVASAFPESKEADTRELKGREWFEATNGQDRQRVSWGEDKE